MTNHVHLLVTPAAPESLPRTMQSLGAAMSATSTQRTDAAERCGKGVIAPLRSSFRAHALGAADALVHPHPLYEALGRTSDERQRTYTALFDAPLAAAFVDELRAATNGGWAVGGERFKQQIAKALGRRVTPGPPGRPATEVHDKRQINLL